MKDKAQTKRWDIPLNTCLLSRTTPHIHLLCVQWSLCVKPSLCNILNVRIQRDWSPDLQALPCVLVSSSRSWYHPAHQETIQVARTVRVNPYWYCGTLCSWSRWCSPPYYDSRIWRLRAVCHYREKKVKGTENQKKVGFPGLQPKM